MAANHQRRNQINESATDMPTTVSKRVNHFELSCARAACAMAEGESVALSCADFEKFRVARRTGP